MMRKYDFVLVNVFAETHFGGNPLAVFPRAAGLNDETMQQIARQFNLSETVFAFPGGDGAAADLRIFTPNYELPMAGHPVLGSGFVLQQEQGLSESFTLNTRAKPVHMRGANGHMQFRISAYRQQECPAGAGQLAEMLGIAPQDIAGKAFFTDSGNPQILIELANPAALRKLNISLPPLKALYRQNPYKAGDEASVYLWCEQGDTVHARMFFEQGGILAEDSGTGSAAANLGAYYLSQNRVPVEKNIRQGDHMGRPNRLSLNTDEALNISVGGQVLQVGSGTFLLP